MKLKHTMVLMIISLGCGLIVGTHFRCIERRQTERVEFFKSRWPICNGGAPEPWSTPPWGQPLPILAVWTHRSIDDFVEHFTGVIAQPGATQEDFDRQLEQERRWATANSQAAR